MRQMQKILLPILFFTIFFGCSSAPVQNFEDGRQNTSATRNISSDCPFDTYEKNWKNQLLIYHFFVGQGDSTFVRTPSGTTMLIDAGLQGKGDSVILPALQACGIKKLDYGLVTHPHIDHFGGWFDLMNAELPIEAAFYIPSEYDENGKVSKGKWKEFKDLLKKKLRLMGARNYSIPKLGETEIVDRGKKVIFDIVAVNCETKVGIVEGCFKPSDKFKAKDSNALSIAQVIHYDKFAYFTGGDLTGGGSGKKDNKPDVESFVARTVRPVDVYRSNHHGSETSNNEALLAALRPKYAVISVGKGGINGDNEAGGKGLQYGYHLPDFATLIRMSKAGVEAIYLTSRGETADPDRKRGINIIGNREIKADVVDNDLGDILLVSDGRRFRFDGKKIEGEHERPREASSPVYEGSR